MLDLVVGTITTGLLWSLLAVGVFITFRVLDVADLTVEGTFPMGAAISAILITSGMNPILSILIAFICWIVMRIWVKVDFLKVFMVTLVISALNFFVTIPNILVFNLVKKISIDSLFWGKTIYDFVHFLVGLFEIYVYFLFTVLLYRLTNLNKWGIAIFLSLLLVGISIIFEPLEAFFS